MVISSKLVRCTKGTIVGSSTTHVFLRVKKSNLQFKHLHTKEAAVKLHLKQWARAGKIPRYTSHNKKIAGCNARPDFVWHMPLHTVVVEVDELQHSCMFSQSAAYKPQKEFQRMFDLSSAVGKPMVIIRYNPDAFKIAGNYCRTSTIDRMHLLLEHIWFAMSTPPSVFITVEYLFYSRVQAAVKTPFIGRFSFPTQQDMANWIDTMGTSWETLTLGANFV